MQDLTNATFKQTIDSNPLVLVDFWAPWCGPCKVMLPTLNTFAKENSAVVVAKVNIDDQPDLATLYKVKSLPTFCVFKNGALVSTTIGMQTKEALKALIG
jgi:thioredoxin 1